MIQTMARIAGNTAKGIWLLIRTLGTATTADIEAAGYKPSVAFEALAELRIGGFIVIAARGIYRATDSGIPESATLLPLFKGGVR